jgi:DNA invertase Pin-like site-specific DNA recombinase
VAWLGAPDKRHLTPAAGVVSIASTLVEESDTTMTSGKFVSYLRVSTDRQGQSGLGLEAQRKAVTDFLNGGSWQLVAEFVETESGAKDERPKLAAALALARAHEAKLLIAKLDRLSRDAHFLLGLQKAGVSFVAADMPEANEMVVGIMAVVAQAERKMISVRTKAALAAAKARGKKLGGFRGYFPTAEDAAKARRAHIAKARSHAESLVPIISRLDPDGSLSLRTLAAKLTAQGLPTPAGAAVWTAATVARIKSRIATEAR